MTRIGAACLFIVGGGTNDDFQLVACGAWYGRRGERSRKSVVSECAAEGSGGTARKIDVEMFLAGIGDTFHRGAAESLGLMSNFLGAGGDVLRVNFDRDRLRGKRGRGRHELLRAALEGVREATRICRGGLRVGCGFRWGFRLGSLAKDAGDEHGGNRDESDRQDEQDQQELEPLGERARAAGGVVEIGASG